MNIVLKKEGMDVQECDVLASGFFEDERPLKGPSGWIDWRFNGMLSHFVIEKRLSGEWRETTLIPSQGRVTPQMILLFGLGKVRDYSYLRLRELPPLFLRTLRKLNFSNICLSFPYGENYNVDCGKLVEVILEGIADSLDFFRDPLMNKWVKDLQLFFAEREEHYYEIFLGVQTAKLILKDRLKIRILTPSEKTPKPTHNVPDH